MNAMYLILLLQLLPMRSNPGGTVSPGYSLQGMTNVGTTIIRTGLSEMLIQAMGTRHQILTVDDNTVREREMQFDRD